MAKSKVFFAADVHGSERCFRKFVNAGKFYECDIIVLGGDLTGKIIVPIMGQPDGTLVTEFLDEKIVSKTKQDLADLEKRIRDIGYYPYVTNPKEWEELQNSKAKSDGLFTELMIEQMKRWINIAEERLKSLGIKCYIMPGNDDRLEIDAVFKDTDYAVNPESKVVELDKYHEMISTGYTNVTPWKAPRDIPEEELSKRIENMISQIKDMKNCIFNFHCPPFQSKLDEAPQLDEQLRPVLDLGGSPRMISVGSVAVRDAIRKYQPLLGLHGHIHESGGISKIGRTLCINPGSEYAEGVLRGAIITLTEKGISNYISVTG